MDAVDGLGRAGAALTGGYLMPRKRGKVADYIRA
jgi:hypothetical protein